MRKALVLLIAACGGGSSPSSIDASTTSPDGPPGPTEPVHEIGRFLPDGTFEWGASALWTRFSGTDLSIELAGSPNHFEVTVDGVSSEIVTDGNDDTIAIATGLASGEHDVRVARRTEAFFASNQFLGFSGGTIIPTPGPSRWIEMVGDSITAGYGILGAGPTCSFDATTESEPAAWGGLAADMLGAAHTSIAWSGIGVYRNNGGDMNNLMPVQFQKVTPTENSDAWTFDTYTPDVVVVNLGTNDFAGGDPGQPYVAAMAAFVMQIRGRYPNAWIVLASSPMLGDPDHGTEAGYLQSVVSGSGDPKVAFLDIPTQLDADGYGCDYHPSPVTAQKMATVLVAKLQELLGW